MVVIYFYFLLLLCYVTCRILFDNAVLRGGTKSHAIGKGGDLCFFVVDE